MSMKFDFRTKLLVIVLTMSLVAVLTSDILIYTLLGVLSVYLIIQGFGRQTIKYLIVCSIFIVLRLLSGGQGITFLMPEMFLLMVLRILMMVMAAQPVIGMPPGVVVAVFKKIHAPDGIALPVTFMLRFFPTVRSEFSDVFAALRLRKLLSWKHPLDAMEYIRHKISQKPFGTIFRFGFGGPDSISGNVPTTIFRFIDFSQFKPSQQWWEVWKQLAANSIPPASQNGRDSL